MKCEEFELSVRDLARHQLFGELMDAGLRAQATAHALACTACKVRLANARNLSESLRSLARSTDSDQAPAQLEVALLAAFRQPTTGAVIPFTGSRGRKQWPRWPLAAAAMLMIGLMSYALRMASSHPAAPTSATLVATPGVLPINKVELGVIPPTPVATPGNASSAKDASLGKPTLASTKRPAKRYRIERYLVESEIATDFLPLTENAEVPRDANLQTIRVEVPRVMMSRFGLPVSFERAAEPVKADLLIGPDGQTRAIRFVQSEFEQPQIISANRDQ